jgi:GNAT superfamily N-acetyltransferase
MEELIINRDVKISIGDYRSYNRSKVLNSKKDTIGKMDYFASAYLNDELVGSLRIKYADNSYIYREVFVLENKRGFGIGKKLMIETLKLLITKNKQIILYVDSKNEIASGLYKKLGFIEIPSDSGKFNSISMRFDFI